jgi:acylpyruvate hydrolase
VDRLHAKELDTAIPTTPIFFLKPTTSYVVQPSPILLPKDIGQVDYEVELGVVMKKPGTCLEDEFRSSSFVLGSSLGRYIRKELAENYVEGYCLAIDVTARELQREAQQKGLPWCLAKGQDTFCPIR